MSCERDRHTEYYLALVQQHEGDWQTILQELPQIRRAWEAANIDDERALSFVWAMASFQHAQGYWQESLHWAERGLQATRVLGQRRNEGTMHLAIGRAHADLGQLVNALPSERILRVMHTFGGKTQQQARGKRLVGLWRDLLLSFSTGFEQDPILPSNVVLAQI